MNPLCEEPTHRQLTERFLADCREYSLTVGDILCIITACLNETITNFNIPFEGKLQLMSFIATFVLEINTQFFTNDEAVEGD